MNSSVRPAKRLRRRTIVILIVVAIILAWLGLLARDLLALRDDVQSLQDYIATLPSPIDPQKIDVPLIQQRMATLHGNLLALHSHAGPLLAISPAFGWLPSIGGEVRSASAFFDLALELADIADNALKTIAPHWPPLATNGKLSLETLAQLSQQMQPGLPALQAGLDRVAAIRPRIDASILSTRTRSLLDRFDAALPLARTGLELLTVAPQLLGVDRPRTYLVMVQNEDELRPTGGFISAAARVTLEAGRIVTMTVIDGNLVDDFTKPQDANPPAPLLDYMGSQLWLFRDANWSPDFPTSARKAADLYTHGQNVNIDGVAALNQRVVKSVVAAMKPIPMSADAPPLTVDNIDEYLRLAWAPPTDPALLPNWFQHRKEFIGQVSQAILQHLLQSAGDVNWTTLIRSLIDRLNGHDLMITLFDPALDKPLSVANWNGALQSTAGDYLMIADSNLGFNKVNVVITQSLAYSVTLQADGQIKASADLTYRNNNPPQPGCDPSLVNYDTTLTYTLLINRCYWDYVRMIVPAGAQFISASNRPVPAEYLVTQHATDGSIDITDELNKTVFGTLLVVERGQALQTSLSYNLPASVITQEGAQTVYRLWLQKQASVSDRPIHFTFNWPAHLQFIAAQPAPTSIGDHFITIDLPFDVDQEIEVRLSAEPH